MAIALMPSVFKDVLLPRQEQPIRIALPPWTAIVVDKFRRARAHDVSNLLVCHEIASSFNLLALICVYLGRLDIAEELCHAATGWVGSLVARTGREECYGAAFGPFINLGRLERIRKRPLVALKHGETVRCALAGCPVSLGEVTLSAHALRLALRHDGLVDVLREAFIVDSLKAMLGAQMFDEVQRFVETHRETAHEWEHNFLVEAHIVALTCCAQFDDAAAIIAAHLSDPKRKGAAVMLYRRAELFAAVEQPVKALAILERLANEVREGAMLGRNAVALMVRVAALLCTCGAIERSRALAGRCLESATALGDVIFQCDAIDVLKSCADSSDERDALGRRQVAIKSAALWGLARTCETRDHDGCRSIHDACDELLAFAYAK